MKVAAYLLGRTLKFRLDFLLGPAEHIDHVPRTYR